MLETQLNSQGCISEHISLLSYTNIHVVRGKGCRASVRQEGASMWPATHSLGRQPGPSCLRFHTAGWLS